MMKYKFQIRDSEAGNLIVEFDTYEEAKSQLKAFEEEDEEEGNYSPDFYEIVRVDEDGDRVDEEEVCL